MSRTIIQANAARCVRPVEMDERTIDLRCNECNAVVGVLDRAVLEDLVWLVNATKVQ